MYFKNVVPCSGACVFTFAKALAEAASPPTFPLQAQAEQNTHIQLCCRCTNAWSPPSMATLAPRTWSLTLMQQTGSSIAGRSGSPAPAYSLPCPRFPADEHTVLHPALRLGPDVPPQAPKHIGCHWARQSAETNWLVLGPA